MTKIRCKSNFAHLGISFLLFLFFINIVSSQGFVKSSEGGASTVTILTNGTDTNETVRFDILVGTDCGAGDFVIGVQDNGALLCATPTSVGDNSSWNQSRYYTNATNTFLLITSFNSNYSTNDAVYRDITNTSYYLVSNPYGYLNTTINTSYYLANNPFSFYNVTTIGALPNTNNYYNSTNPQPIINTSYYLVSNPYGYLNTTINTSYQLKSNYTDWNSSGWIINWSQIISSNGITLATLLGFGYFNETTKNITNNSYYLVSNPYGYLNSSYNATYNAYNSTGLIRDWNASGLIKSWASASEVDPYWTANYTSLNDTWSSRTNTSYYLASNPYGYLNTTINTSYQLKSNYTDWNASGWIINWSQVISSGSGVTLSQLLGFNYWNSTFATFNKTYADTLYYGLSNPYSYLNTTINTSYMLVTSWNTNYSTNNANWLSTTNTSYYLANNPFSFYNSTTLGAIPNTNNYWNTTFANFNKTYADTLYCSISEPLWTGNFTAYNSSWTSTINTTYQLKTNYTDWNVSGFIRDWNATGYIKNWALSEVDPYWTGNFTAYNNSWSLMLNTSYALVSEPFWTANYTSLNNTWSSIINTSYRTLTNNTFDSGINITNQNITSYGAGIISTNTTCVTIWGATAVLEVC